MCKTCKKYCYDNQEHEKNRMKNHYYENRDKINSQKDDYVKYRYRTDVNFR